MEKVQSLADYLLQIGALPAPPVPEPASEGSRVILEDIVDAKAFSEALLNSREFRLYIINSLTLGTLPAPILTRVMDYAWGKPADRVEVTGKDGQPVQTVTEVRRVIVHEIAPNTRRTH